MLGACGCGDGTVSPDGGEKPSTIEDVSGRRDAYRDVFPSFGSFVRSGVGDGEIDLPTGVWAGVAEVVSSEGASFSLWEVDEGGVPITTLVNTVGEYSGVVPFGLDGLEAAARLVVRAEGPWTATIRSVREAPELSDRGDGDGVYWNSEDGRDVTWSFPADDVFKVVTYPDYALPEVKHYVIPHLDHPELQPGSVVTRAGHVAARDSLIVVSSGGVWTLT